MATDLFLIRHGQSYANVDPVIGGMKGDHGLTDLGREQADRLGRRLRREEFEADVLYCSTLPRARETVRPVAKALGLEVSYDDELQELRPGDADGLSTQEWADRWPPVDDGGFAQMFEPFATGGESWAGFIVRASAAIGQLLVRHPNQRVVAVTHGGLISASMYLISGGSGVFSPVSYSAPNTSITWLRYDRSATRRPWTLISFGDAAHLRG